MVRARGSTSTGSSRDGKDGVLDADDACVIRDLASGHVPDRPIILVRPSVVTVRLYFDLTVITPLPPCLTLYSSIVDKHLSFTEGYKLMIFKNMVW